MIFRVALLVAALTYLSVILGPGLLHDHDHDNELADRSHACSACLWQATAQSDEPVAIVIVVPVAVVETVCRAHLPLPSEGNFQPATASRAPPSLSW